MKKVILLVAVAAFAVAGLSSCKKCTTCEWKYNGTSLLTYPEQCGSTKDIDDWKATVNALYAGSGYEFVCTDK
jgi:hypothetical protein